MKKIILVYIGLVVVVILLAVWRLGAFGFLSGGGDGEVKIGGQTVKVEIADNDEERAKGLSGRDKLEEGNGMLFVFDEKTKATFWMKDMEIPIDIIFIDENKVVTLYPDVQPPQGDNPNLAELPTYSPTVPVNYVLEVPAGYAAKNNIKNGDTAEVSL